MKHPFFLGLLFVALQANAEINVTQAIWSGHDVSPIAAALCASTDRCTLTLTEERFGAAENISNRSFHIQWKCSGSDTIHHYTEPHDALNKEFTIECKQRDVTRRKKVAPPIEPTVQNPPKNSTPTDWVRNPKLVTKPSAPAPLQPIIGDAPFPSPVESKWDVSLYSRSFRNIAAMQKLPEISQACSQALGTIFSDPGRKLISTILKRQTTTIAKRLMNPANKALMHYVSADDDDVRFAMGKNVIGLFDRKRHSPFHFISYGMMELCNPSQCPKPVRSQSKMKVTLRRDATVLLERNLHSQDSNPNVFKKIYQELVTQYAEFAGCKEEFYGTFGSALFFRETNLYHLILEENGIDAIDYDAGYDINLGQFLRVLNPYAISTFKLDSVSK